MEAGKRNLSGNSLKNTCLEFSSSFRYSLRNSFKTKITSEMFQVIPSRILLVRISKISPGVSLEVLPRIPSAHLSEIKHLFRIDFKNSPLPTSVISAGVPAKPYLGIPLIFFLGFLWSQIKVVLQKCLQGLFFKTFNSNFSIFRDFS